MKIRRLLQIQVEQRLFQGKAVVIYGARQVGKTTMARDILSKFGDDGLYLNADEPEVRSRFREAGAAQIRSLFGAHKVVVIDEAQRIENIGITLKIAVDTLKDVQIIATGSSSFELANNIMEPLTGRVYEFSLHPLSLEEVLPHLNATVGISRALEDRMVLGMYPEVFLQGVAGADLLKTISRTYAYKDILQYEGIRNPELVEKLLIALALQLGNEVSWNELAQTVGANRATVLRYVRILEQAFIIFRLRPYSRNRRKELSKLHKIYFMDIGLRNALIGNLNPLSMRADVGALWENFWIAERRKYLGNHGKDALGYFWRTFRGQEIDYVEEGGGVLTAFECKWNTKENKRVPTDWRLLYPDALYHLITPDSAMTFLKQ
ncbi:MAG: ATPase [Candidatus Vogelbacteria bacterium CG10_big_fil_rev_8_21_14_0_10_45_14]|uniref:ATPase n=1 Tax=Candidatus Vogelbacteria bacterium CG10_big_fil_rev_8_21_14_0_10_45_14 TaxID=1975042 RepID=A0A2H0RJU7_9BACT|nr:MAG: ATPase [Candidatus Vogelbacteria bacterium CG10_big_fil_rev_8_21_14_0_10_45_14]